VTDHAIVIGLDKYARPEWNLSAAVADAMEFARWVTEPGKGRATPETLTLLLSPLDGVEPALPFTPASQQEIAKALRRYLNGPPIDVDVTSRLWFFYAGHAVSASSSAPDDPPVLVPPEVDDIDAYLFEPLALTKYLGALQVRKPQTQIFFIDACRGVVQSSTPFAATNGIAWDLGKLGSGLSGAQSQQVVLYAATLGESANEVGASGVFSQALRQGLRGRGPYLKSDEESGTFTLEFSALTRFTQRRVRSLVADAIKKGKKIEVQDPTSSLFRNPGDLVLERFEELLPAKLRVFVTPPGARLNGRAAIKTASHTGRFVLVDELTPLTDPVVWELPPGPRTFQLSSPGFRTETCTVDLIDEIAVPVTLKELTGALESLDSRKMLGTTPKAFDPSAESATSARASDVAAGNLTIITHDRLARVVVTQAGKTVLARYGDVKSQLFPIGSYRASVTFPGLPPIDRPFVIDQHEQERWDVTPSATLSSRLVKALDGVGIPVSNCLSQPAEAFGATTTTRLGSLLAWAAWAARFPNSSNGNKLRGLALAPLPAAAAAVQILLGDAAPAGEAEFLASVQVSFGESGGEAALTLQPVVQLAGLALEASAAIESSQAHLVILGRGLRPMNLPVPKITGHVHVIVIASESDGGIEIQRFLLPLEPRAAGYHDLSDAVRTSELHARALAARTPLLANEAEDALNDPLLDPLTTALVGFRLAHQRRLAAVGTVWRVALERVSQLAPDLPDLHVLAALSADEPATRAKHMERASDAGAPIIADGFVAFVAWLEEQAAELGRPPPVAVRALVRGGAWSLFESARRGVGASRAAVPASSLVTSTARWAARIQPASEATVRLEAPGTGLSATAFFVAPGRLLTMGFALPQPVGRPLLPGMLLSPEWLAAGVERVTLRRLLALSSAGPQEMSNLAIRLALVETDVMPVPEISLDMSAPSVGQRVAVIAHNALELFSTSRRDKKAIAAAFAALESGEKAVMPGEVTEVDPSGSSFSYDCWTLAGSAGGPVVDLETGAVIGIHYGGTPPGAKRKLGVGLPWSFLVGDPLWLAAKASSRARSSSSAG